MRIHHLNSTTLCPLGGFLVDGRSEGLEAHLVCHCLAIETDRHGIVLVDTGLGLEDVRHPEVRLSRVFRRSLRPRLLEKNTLVRHLGRIGIAPRDVRHIVLTHLDFDHAGGLDDFPEARVHLLASEDAVASRQRSLLDRMRYRPAQWRSRSRWHTYKPARESWFGFESVRAIPELADQVLLVPLAGHTLGHAGVAVQAEDGWLLHCGDAYFYHQEASSEGHHCSPGLRLYQKLMEQNGELRLENQRRLRELTREHGDQVRLFCAHDLTEFVRFKQAELARASDAALTDGSSVSRHPRFPN